MSRTPAVGMIRPQNVCCRNDHQTPILAQITTYTLRNGAVRAVREEENLYAAIDLAADKVCDSLWHIFALIPHSPCVLRLVCSAAAVAV